MKRHEEISGSGQKQNKHVVHTATTSVIEEIEYETVQELAPQNPPPTARARVTYQAPTELHRAHVQLPPIVYNDAVTVVQPTTPPKPPTTNK